MSRLTCVRVGYGKVSKIHAIIFHELNVETIAVVEIDMDKQQEAKSKGYLVFTDCREAAYLQPFFWDICVSTHQHVCVIEEIINYAPNANILVEKPICGFKQIKKLKKALKNFKGKLVVNENYASSQISILVKETVWEKLKFLPRLITVEFTKNRLLDNKQGRFIDHELGVIGYEGSHMVEIASQISKEELNQAMITSKYYECENTLEIKAKLKSKIKLCLYTSISGQIKYKYPVFTRDDILIDNQESKYRLVAVDGNDAHNNQYTVVGFFEPIDDFNRNEGAILIIKNGRVLDIIKHIPDNSMANHFRRAINYFNEQTNNPYNLERAIKVVEVLQNLQT